MPRISIALTTYNGARHLGAQLESLAAQTRPPDELVVSDDGSTDETWELLEAFARRAPFPVERRRNPENLGWQDNFVQTALRCCGDWVGFCDQDDVWRPDKLARVEAVIREHPDLVMVVHSARLTDEELRPTGQLFPHFRRFRRAPPLSNPPLLAQLGFAVTFRRDLLRDIPVDRRPCDPNLPDRRQSHDQLVPLLANALGPVAYLPDVLVDYRRHVGAASGAEGTGDHGVDWRSRLAGILSAGHRRYLFLSDVARRSADFLALCAAEQSSAQRRDALAAGAQHYAALAESLATRASIHSGATSTLPALAGVVGLLGRGAYAPIEDGGHLGHKALLKDVATALLRVAR